MAEYIDRAKAKEELLSWARCIKHPEHLMTEDAMCVLDGIPAADVVEVVRCEKCRFGRNPLPDHGVRRCSKTLMFHPSDWYCPDGARMDGE